MFSDLDLHDLFQPISGRDKQQPKFERPALHKTQCCAFVYSTNLFFKGLQISFNKEYSLSVKMEINTPSYEVI